MCKECEARTYLQLGYPLVEEVDQVGVYGLQDGDGRHGVEVGAVPLVEEADVVAHGDENLPEEGELAGHDVGGDGAVAVLLGAKVDEVGTHGEPLAVPQLCHAEVGGHVLVGHLVTNAPSHIHHLKKVRPSKIASCSALQSRKFV